MSRVDAIKNYAVNKIAEEEKAAIALRERICGYKEAILDLKPRIDELLEVGNACLQNGIPLEGQAFGGHEGYDTHQFITNSWSHLLGFVAEKDRPFTKLGIAGGGACDYNLKTDGVDITVSGNAVAHVLKRFVDEFDNFERSFYAYVDGIVSINS